MTGGTFTITNGGVFGSMLSTPIINPPQSAILGMHNIVERPIAVDGKVEIHPIMYVALSYDHRIIDGRESVSFLVKVKELLENPVKMMFGSKDVDFLVLGSGIAGLSYALKVAPHGKVLIVTKNAANDTATWYAQGGIAAVMYTPDSYEKHIQDTLNAGCYLNDEKIVRMTITESTQRVKELIEWGTHFDTESSGKYALAREGGHSEKRVLHYQDKTGAEIQRALIEKVKQHPNIEMLENHFSIDLITQHQLGKIVRRSHPDIQCFGAYVLNPEKGEIITVLAKTTMIATGGSGNVYQTTTNPKIATGDGIAMLYRAKGVVDNMEFIQFHPTSLYNPNEKPSFLISEALRGAGAELKDIDGKEFMQRYDKRKSLAPRDIVARAIDNEMKLSGHDHVYLDARHIDESEIMHHFPTIYAKCLSIGINITKEMIPVVPAAHYICGGIKTDEHGATSIKNAFASGEVTSTGLHGANRLASNSLLESLVFSHNASLKAVELKNLTEIQSCSGNEQKIGLTDLLNF